ncbi:hypothetical protein AAFF_G00341100 [Aldrovandia affinis]|uniref:Uncharacterized protein n=1 Tax=Aldrovandia affinis TaxID=143900 RepID=A0AAD7WPB7_9TELE|nr:hypothetical protein AAFF_G00341100 [Aldrovandia affinis]
MLLKHALNIQSRWPLLQPAPHNPVTASVGGAGRPRGKLQYVGCAEAILAPGIKEGGVKDIVLQVEVSSFIYEGPPLPGPRN